MLPTITIDIGTTSVKLCLFNELSELSVSIRRDTPTLKDKWGLIYDLPALREVITGFIHALTPMQRSNIARIAITGVGESGGLVGPDMTAISPMILWHDHRGIAYLNALTPMQRTNLYQVTGLPVNGNYGLSKVAWALEHAGDATVDAKWLNISEYIAALMTGERWSEYSLASRTMALDLVKRTWSAEVCEMFGIDTAVFPELRSSAQGTLISTHFADEVGLPSTVQVHVAGHDHIVGAIGAQLQPGEVLNSTGTTEGVLLLIDSPRLDHHAEVSKLANGLACSGQGYTLFSSIPTGGSAFATLQKVIGINADDLNDIIVQLYEKYVAGEIDLERIPLVLPRFRGSPSPDKDADARGVIAGLRTDTTREEIVFGTFLGLVLQYQDVLTLLRPNATTRIKVIGPASENPLWLQLKADLLGTSLSASSLSEVVSRGAQALACGEVVEWDATKPRQVDAHQQRHNQLAAWSAQIQQQWDYLKGMPT